MPGLSLLFDVCFGERGRMRFGKQGEFLHKSIPSGGARHPTEVFLVAFDGGPVLAGVHHYNVEHHRLDLIRAGDYFEVCARTTFDLFKKFDSPPIALVVFTALYERAMWRYRDPRSWRAVMVDIGHGLMAMRRVAAALGFAQYTYQKFDDDALCDLLGLNPVRQTPLFVGTLV
jgi:SagB-type dehydrogenase family enzyme